MIVVAKYRKRSNGGRTLTYYRDVLLFGFILIHLLARKGHKALHARRRQR